MAVDLEDARGEGESESGEGEGQGGKNGGGEGEEGGASRRRRGEEGGAQKHAVVALRRLQAETANGGSREDEAIDFHARLNFEEGSSSEEYWSTSSSDEDDDFAYDTAVGRHACQHMLNEMQRRRPPGLVFHHTQPLRPASPPPGIARGAEANTNFKETKRAAAGDDADASSSESDSTSSSSDSSDSDSDSEAAAEKRRVAAALEKQRRAAEAEAKAKMQPPPRSGVAKLGVHAEPPPPSQATAPRWRRSGVGARCASRTLSAGRVSARRSR